MDDALIDLIIGYASQERQPLVNYTKFLEYAEEYAYNNNLTDLIHKVRDHKIEIIPTLMQWEYKGACTIFRKESTVDSILIHTMLKEVINIIYTQIEQNPEIPFPVDTQFGFQIPERLILTIDVASEFIAFLGEIDNHKQPLVKMVFPEEAKGLIVCRDIVKTRLIECALLKLSRYLQFKMNVSYMHNRLETLLSGNLEAIKTMINDIITKPKKVVQQLYDGDDFSFRFFAQFTSVILKDYRDKKNKHEDEHGFLQSSHLLGLYIGFQKSIVQREYQRELELSQLEKQFRKPPYAFSTRDLFDLKDTRGVRYIDKYSKDFIMEFIRRMTKVTDSSRLPALISVKVSDDKDYLIHKDFIVPLFLNGLKDASNTLYREYIDEWQTLLKNNTKLPSMKYNGEFVTELNYRIKHRYPLLNALRNPYLLTIIKDELTLSGAHASLIEECFSKKNTLRPIDELLELKREKILSEVKMLLPFWYTWPVIKHVFFLFKWLLGKSNKSFKSQALRLWQDVKGEFKRGAEKEYSELLAARKEEEIQETSGPTRKQVIAKYKTHIDTLKAQIIGRTADLDHYLEEIREKWNPLYDPEAKANLVEDVNCFIRDYIRRIKKTFRLRLPDADQVKNMAAHLVDNKNLQVIKKKETLKMYIEAYIVKILEEQHHIR